MHHKGQDCNCSEVGSINQVCDDNGQCNCKDNVCGLKCDACDVNTFGYPICEGCNCDPDGSISLQCDANGDCTCKEGFAGSKCGSEKYQIPNEMLSFNDAVKRCSDLGGKLFEPKNADEDDYVYDYIKKRFGGRREYWIGIVKNNGK